MTLPAVFELFNYWAIKPPVHELVAGFIGYKPPASARMNKAKKQDFADFFAAMTGSSLPVKP